MKVLFPAGLVSLFALICILFLLLRPAKAPMSSAGFSARASLFRDLRSASRSDRDSPVSHPPSAPPVSGSPAAAGLTSAFSSFGLGVGAPALRDPRASTLRGDALSPRASGTGEEFVSVSGFRAFGDQFLDRSQGLGPSGVASCESFSLDGGVTDSDILAAAWQMEHGDTSTGTSVKQPFKFSSQSKTDSVLFDIKQEGATSGPSAKAKDPSQFLDYANASLSCYDTGLKPSGSAVNNGEPIASELQNSVTVVELDLVEDLLCGAIVGAAGKFCRHLKGHCTKKSHRKGPSFLDSLREQGLKRCLFIDVPVPPRGQSLAFQDPFLDATKLPNNKIQEMLQTRKPVWLWSHLFAMLAGDATIPEDGEEDDSHDLQATAVRDSTPLRMKSLSQLQKQAQRAAFTPAKRLALEQVEVPSPIEEDNGPRPIPADVDDKTFRAMVIQNSRAVAKSHRLLTNEVLVLRTRQQEQTDLINVLVDKINVLNGIIGTPPSGVQAATIWQAISDDQSPESELGSLDPRLLAAISETQEKHGASFQRMYDSIDDLNRKVQMIKTEAMHSSRKEVVALITEQVNRIIWQELSRSAPTLQVAEKFFLKGGLNEFEHHIRKTTAAAIRAGGEPGGQTTSMFNLSSQDISNFKKIISQLEEETRSNNTRLSDLEARSENQTVEIEGFKFASLSQVAAFVNSNSMAKDILKFVDPIGLMEKSTLVSQSFSENVKVQYEGHRSNMESPGDQKVLYSFQLTAPTALAGTPEQARNNPSKLPKIDTYSKFKGSGSRDSGAANTIRAMMSEKYSAFLSDISNSPMSREAKVIAKSLLSEARRFLDTLFIYMKDQVEDYGSDTNLSEERRWDLVQNITRIVFEVLSQPRRACSEIAISQATSVERAPELLWAVLQTYRLQKDFLEHNFKNHPKVGPMLTHFLLDVVSFHDDVNPILDDVKKALSEAQQAKRKADAVESQIKNVQSRLPSKKTKAQGEGSS